jgi:hypothetical protein
LGHTYSGAAAGQWSVHTNEGDRENRENREKGGFEHEHERVRWVRWT